MTATPEVDLLVEFLNTVDVETGEEELPDDATCAAWFQAHGVAADGVIATEARQVRNALRAAADGHGAPGPELAVVPLQATVSDDGELSLASEHPLAPLVVTAVRLAHEGLWERLKLCHMHTCRYAFFDSSRNRSGRWCSMAVCGNRAKTRAFRERQKS